jgi:hypothetical protein
MITKTQQQKEKQVYAYEKNRTDSLQMPINFYIKSNKVEVSENTKYLKYNITVE